MLRIYEVGRCHEALLAALAVALSGLCKQLLDGSIYKLRGVVALKN
ncbi:hypothetical protein EV13_2065 [Prochlorococcus sp. MIT 0702]|nr:hypothetical protein EV13_2065 [Prochlorococcus sp. MIT 0702]KGG28225.1 hypothetical protein EV12_0975 [Prochlorococcus sp. MIT 0701]KGG37275.1 hypothetical protein EV14_0067 [Prochlorococcus sp. MIT 0703]